MLQITTDVSSLNTQERDMLAAFILTFGIREPKFFDELAGRYTSLNPKGEFEPLTKAPAESREEFAASFEHDIEGTLTITEVPADIDPASVFSLTPATPVAPPPPGPVLVPSPTVTDKAGLMWDERIHASTKALTADGNWRKKRGVADDLVTQVEAELRQLAPAPQAPPPPPAPTGAPAPPQPPPAPAANDRKAYIDLMQVASAGVQAGKLSPDELTNACATRGVQSFQLLANRLDLVAAVTEEIQNLIASRG